MMYPNIPKLKHTDTGNFFLIAGPCVVEDKVVPIASHKAFADAYRSTGNVCEFFEYPATALGASRPCEASVGKIVWEALT